MKDQDRQSWTQLCGLLGRFNATQLSVVYFNELLGAACTRKLVKILFSAVFVHFKPFAVISRLKSTENV